VLSLPGNPLSVLATYLLFAKPILSFLTGKQPDPAFCFDVQLAEAIEKTHERLEFARGVIERDAAGQWQAWPQAQQGSHRLSSLLGGEFKHKLRPGSGSQVVLIELAEGARHYEARERVRCYPLAMWINQ
jgi:molybdopterin molybdotransferase